MREKLARASLRLKTHLFGPGHPTDPLGFVGIAPPDTIWVYLHCSAARWRGPQPGEWEGFKVRWRYKVGPIVAQFDKAI